MLPEGAVITEPEVRTGLLHIWDVMQECVHRGITTEGVLPGERIAVWKDLVALGFQTDRMEVGQRSTDPALDTVQGVVVEPSCQA